jgi:ABC-type transport system involved in cytochrome c biogenesis permease component
MWTIIVNGRCAMHFRWCILVDVVECCIVAYFTRYPCAASSAAAATATVTAVYRILNILGAQSVPLNTQSTHKTVMTTRVSNTCL